MSKFQRASIIKKSLGPWVAARYLAKRGVSLEAALWHLCRAAPR